MHNNSPSFIDEPFLSKRVEHLSAHFKKEYGNMPEVTVRSPGRAEILGNHTDYNQGFALASAISRSIIGCFRKRKDDIIRIQSTIFPGEDLTFALKDTTKDPSHFWINYPRAVIHMLVSSGFPIGGADIVVDTDVPKSGGVSSSAAFELAIARGMLALYGQHYDELAIARLCQKAENSPIVNSPCGFLDQGTVALGLHGQLVFFDFKPTDDSPVSEVKRFPLSLEKHNASFVIMVDTHIERHLGESGYVARRRMCEESLPFWSELLRKDIHSLRDVSVEDFVFGKDKLEAHNPVMRKRVEHIVYENNRVLEAVDALNTEDVATFGKLLSQSGDSALSLYELDEGTPQLTYLVKTAQELSGVLGARNMGGGFSAIALSLVENNHMESFKETLGRKYKEKFGNELSFIEFLVTNGTELL